MGFINFYNVRKIFKGEPKNLRELRDAQMAKLAEFKEKGTFAFTMKSQDAQPAMVISWSGTAHDKGVWDLVKPPKFIKGSYVAEAKKKTYAFTTDPDSKKLVLDYLKDPDFSVAMWNLIGPEVNLITVDGKVLTRRTLNDAEWKIAEWDVNRALTADNGLFKKAPLPVKEVTPGKQTQLVTENGLILPEENILSVKIFGKLVEKAEANESVAGELRAKIPDAFKPLVEKLAKELIKIDSQIPKDKDPKHDNLVKQANDALDKFQADAEKAITESVVKQWLVMLDANVDYRDFKIDTAVSLTKGFVSLSVGVTTAALGGISGVGAVLGLVGTIKGALEMATTAYTAFRAVEGLGDELGKIIAASIAAQYAAGWRDFGKTVLGKLPGGPVLQQALSRGGISAKPVKDIEKEVKTYNGKVSGLLVSAKNMGKQVNDVITKSDLALKALETPEVKEAEKQDKKLAESNAKKRKLIAEATTKFLDDIGSLSQRFEKGKENVDKYGKLIEILKESMKEDKLAAFLTKYLAPLLDLPWGIDPENLRATLQSAGTIGLELVGNVLSDLKLSGETGDEVKEWTKFANDTINGLKGIQELLKK